MANRITKSEHNGAKNGGGAWETRANAKAMSNKVRRAADKVALPHCGTPEECGYKGYCPKERACND